MKKVSILLIVFIIMSLFAVSFADEVVPEDDTGAYIDSASELDALYGGQDTTEEVDQLKEAYDMYQEYLLEYYDVYERPNTYKAKVIEVKEPRDEYFQQDYYSVSKYVLQPIKVEILEGEYKGKQKEFDYVLTMDSLNNINIQEAKVGDVIFVSVDLIASGDIDVTVPNSWASVSRFHVVIILAIIAVLLLVIYGGKKGITTAGILLSAIIGTIIVICTFGFNAMGVIWASIFLMVAISLMISILHLGFSKQMLKSFLISLGMVLVTWFVLFIACSAARSAGISFEFAAIAENIINNKIDFTQMYYIITLLIASGVISNTIAMSANRMLKENVDSFKDRIEVSRKALASNLIVLVITAFALYIPNHILLLSNKFLLKEILNSETLVSELIRFLVIVITTTISVPIASLDVFGFGKKFIKAADITEVNNTSTSTETTEKSEAEKAEAKK